MRKSQLGILFLVFGILSCYPKPELPVAPSIRLENYYFKETDTNTKDSLKIVLKFEDGDGDLGISANNIYPPYHLYDFFVFNGDTLKIGDNDTLPEFNCRDYEIIRKELDSAKGFKVDTIYVQRNKNHYNYYVDFLVKEGNEYKVYDFWEEGCSPPIYNRFFPLNREGGERPLKGTLIYGTALAFRLAFRYDSIKLRIQIQDSSLHKSNVVETEPFMITDIIQPQ